MIGVLTTLQGMPTPRGVHQHNGLYGFVCFFSERERERDDEFGWVKREGVGLEGIGRGELICPKYILQSK